LHEAANALFETKNVPPIMTDVDTTITVIKARIVVGFIILYNAVTSICIYGLRYLLLSLDSITITAKRRRKDY
jgi:hypothetical protein